MKAKLKLKNGMILTVIIFKEDNVFIEGEDKFGEAVKVEKEDILMRLPIHDLA
jgi:hypothetical protein